MDSDLEEYKPQKKQRKSAAGRKLMRWSPDIDQLLLLTVDVVCANKEIHIPWDEVAKHIEPHLTGEAIKQHLAKVTKAREDNHRKVPEKLKKGPRRKAKLAVALDPTTPARGGNATKTKNEAEVDEDADTPNKGANLLYNPPTKLSKAAKTGTDTTPKTPGNARGASRKKAASDVGSGDSFGDTKKSIGKRGRKEPVVKEDPDESNYGSATKKQKTTEQMIEKPLARRAKEGIDYSERIDSDDDILAAPPDDDQDDAYQETQESPQNYDVNYGLSFSSQGTMGGDVQSTSPSSTVPAGMGLQQSFPQSVHHTYAHGHNNGFHFYPPNTYGNMNISGLPEGYGQQFLPSNNFNYGPSATRGFANFRSLEGFRPHIASGFGSSDHHAWGVGNYETGLQDLHPEQELRDDFGQSLMAMSSEHLTDVPLVQSKEKANAPRKKLTRKETETPDSITSKAKQTENGFSPIVSTLKAKNAKDGAKSKATPRAEDDQATMTKIESAQEGMDGDVFDDKGTGMIPITNDTGYIRYINNIGDCYPGIFEGNNLKPNIYASHTQQNSGMRSINVYGEYSFNGDYDYNVTMPTLDTNPNRGPPTPMTASPDALYGNGLEFNDAHSGVTPTMNTFQFNSNFNNPSFNNPQLTPFPSQSNSFSSTNAFESVEAIPTIEQGGGDMIFGAGVWNPGE